MPRINFNGQSFEVPGQVSGRDLRQILGLSQNEVPVRIGRDGGYEPVNENNEYHIEDEMQFDRVHRLENG